MTREIPLTRGQVALVDDDEYERLSRYTWACSPAGYAYTRFNGATVYMHRLIMHTPKGLETDHINRKRLDNRKENLRNVTRFVNLQNRGPRGKYRFEISLVPQPSRRIYEKRYSRWPCELTPGTMQTIRSRAKELGISYLELTRQLIQHSLQSNCFDPSLSNEAA